MAELIIIIAQNKQGVVDGLKMKSALEKIGIEVVRVLIKETDGSRVPTQLIEKLMKARVVEDIDEIKGISIQGEG